MPTIESRRPWSFRRAAIVVAAAAAATGPAYAGEASLPLEETRVDAAVERAIGYLLTQQHGDGAIVDRGPRTAMTALSVMAMASVGTQPQDQTDGGRAMAAALDYVLADERVDEKGYFGRKDNSRMYGHGIVTLMLTEMLGMGTSAEQDRLIHDRCQAAIDVILSSQRLDKSSRYTGGWRYEPHSRDADLSVSVWQVMALRSARNDGLAVPKRAIDDAVAYLERSYASPVRPSGQPVKAVDGFVYEPNGGKATFPMTSAGLLAMQVCGEYESPLVAGAADWLLEHPPAWKQRYCCYGLYYYAQGMHQRGGTHESTARRVVADLLLDAQSDNGSWEAGNGSERNHGRVYATTLAVLSLSVKYHYLPIYQR